MICLLFSSQHQTLSLPNYHKNKPIKILLAAHWQRSSYLGPLNFYNSTTVAAAMYQLCHKCVLMQNCPFSIICKRSCLLNHFKRQAQYTLIEQRFFHVYGIQKSFAGKISRLLICDFLVISLLSLAILIPEMQKLHKYSVKVQVTCKVKT